MELPLGIVSVVQCCSRRERDSMQGTNGFSAEKPALVFGPTGSSLHIKAQAVVSQVRYSSHRGMMAQSEEEPRFADCHLHNVEGTSWGWHSKGCRGNFHGK